MVGGPSARGKTELEAPRGAAEGRREWGQPVPRALGELGGGLEEASPGGRGLEVFMERTPPRLHVPPVVYRGAGRIPGARPLPRSPADLWSLKGDGQCLPRPLPKVAPPL